MLANSSCQCQPDCTSLWNRHDTLKQREQVIEICNDRSDYLGYLLSLCIMFYDRTDDCFEWKVNGQSCCKDAWSEFWMISKYYMNKLCTLTRQGLPFPMHGNNFVDRDAYKERLCRHFLQMLANVNEQMPDSLEVHLISNTTKIMCYEEFIHVLGKSIPRRDIPSRSMFYHTWAKWFPHLKLPKKNRLGKCDVCCDFEERIRTSVGAVKTNLIAQKHAHSRQVRIELVEMQNMHARAKNQPSEWTCISSDWSNPHLMPHRPTPQKGWMTKKRLKYHVFGIVNAADSQVTLFPHFDHWEHDSNLHISLLFNHLRELRDKGKLGRNLMIQMDNCFRDNKNKYLFAFFAYLLHHQWFRTIELYYLRPGHSHGIVDKECFQPMGSQNRCLYGYWTPEEFWDHFVHLCFRGHPRKPKFLDFTAICDWKDFFGDTLRNMKFHSFQRAFLFKLSEEKPVLYFKKHLLRDTWLGLKKAPENGLEIITNFSDQHPSVLLPIPMAEEEFVDVITLSKIPAIYSQFWTTFSTNQFNPETYGVFTQSWMDDFWLANVDMPSSSSSEDMSDVTTEERDLHVIHHPSIIPYDELTKGVLIAIRAPANDEDYRDQFWVASIVSSRVKYRRGRNITCYKVRWYDSEVRGNNQGTTYTRSDNYDKIEYGTILHHGFRLSQRNMIRQTDLNKILANV